MMARPQHAPVLVDRVVELLAPALAPTEDDRRPLLVDCTTGLGGHSAALLEACPDARLIGLDRDPEALATAGERLHRFGDRVRLDHAVYDQLPEVLADAGERTARAVLFDLGLSSLQIDRTERGFAYAVDAPLDMRMDPGQRLTAAEVLNTYSASDLARILRRYGEERYADRIARRIITERDVEPFESSARLVALLRAVIPPPRPTPGRRPGTRDRAGGHPAKRTFQALRIEVNAELAALEAAVPAAIAALSPGGRIAVLAYHSLEDRMVKQVFAGGATDRAPRGLPVVPPELRPELKLLTRGAEKPGADEVADNPRAASARLRAAMKLERTKTGGSGMGEA